MIATMNPTEFNGSLLSGLSSILLLVLTIINIANIFKRSNSSVADNIAKKEELEAFIAEFRLVVSDLRKEIKSDFKEMSNKLDDSIARVTNSQQKNSGDLLAKIDNHEHRISQLEFSSKSQ